MKTNLTFKSTNISYLVVGLLVSACGTKMERSSQVGGGGGNGNGTFTVTRVPTCKATEVLAMDGSMITLRTAFEGSANRAVSVSLDGAAPVDLSNSNVAVTQCTTADKEKQIVTMTVPYYGSAMPSSVLLNLESSTSSASQMGCGPVDIRSADPFAASTYVCEDAARTNSAQADGMALMTTSQIGRLAKLTVSTSELSAPSYASYPAVVDFGDNSPKPFIIRPPSAGSISTVDKLYTDVSDSNPSGSHMVRVVMYNRKGVRSVVQKTVTHGLYSTTGIRPTYFAENGGGAMVGQQFINFTEPKPIAPTNVIAVGYGPEDNSSNPAGGSVVVYRLPADGNSAPQRVLTIPNPFLSLAAAYQKLGTRVAMGDIDKSGNLSLVISQETDKYISVYNESTGQKLMPPVDLEDIFAGGSFSSGSNEAITLSATGDPQILVTNRTKNVYALKFDNIMGLTTATPGNPTPFANTGILGEVRVAALGPTVVYQQSSRNDKGVFLKNGQNVAAEGNSTAGSNAWFTLGYNDATSKDMFAIAGKGASGEVNFYQPQNLTSATTFKVFQRANGGVRTSVADVNNDGFSDIIVAQGRDTGGTTNQVAVVDGKSVKEGAPRVLYQFAPFANFKGGLYVSGHTPYRAP